MGDFLILLAEINQTGRVLIAIAGALAVMLLALLLLFFLVRRFRRLAGSAPAAKFDEHHTPPYLPALPSSPTLVVESTGTVVPLSALPLVLGRAPESGLVL